MQKTFRAKKISNTFKKTKMLILIFQITYAVIFLSMILMGVFVIFHIVSYSYTTISKIITLAIFVPVAAVLLLTNLILFTSINLRVIFSDVLS